MHLVVGRFQPLHLGHVAVIEAALQAGDTVVAIGSSNQPLSARNPFTVAERQAMLQAVFPGVRTVPVPDYGDGARWVRHVLGAVPVGTVWGNDEETLHLFEAAGVAARRIGLQERGQWQAAVIREQVARGDPAWRQAVPPQVAGLLDAWDAPRRMALLAAA